MKHNKLSSREWELISAYLDNELNAQERARMEERINTRPEYQEALEGLRRTKTILKRAPVHKVPRNFTLTAADVLPARLPRWIPATQWSAAAAALAAVFLFAYQLVPGFPAAQFKTSSRDLGAAAPSQEALEFAAPEEMAAAEETPEIIYWGGAPLSQNGPIGMGGANGIGGGSGGDGSLIVGGGADAPAPSEMFFPQPPIPNTLPDLQAGETVKVAAEPTESVRGTGPVLGVRPKEEQGEVLPETQRLIAQDEQTMQQAEEAETSPWLWAAAGGLLTAAVGLFIAGLIARRKILH